MLMRGIEAPVFNQTRQWLQGDRPRVDHHGMQIKQHAIEQIINRGRQIGSGPLHLLQQ